MTELPLFHNRKTGKPIWVNLTGHVLLSGSTSSGKSVAMLHIVHCISKLSSTGDKLTILDYKGSKDWKELRGITGYYSVEESKVGFEQAYLLFRNQLEGVIQIGDNIHWLVIEEMASLAESYTSKVEKAEFFQRFGEMLRLSRNIGDGEGGWRIIVTMQQPDSSLMGGHKIAQILGYVSVWGALVLKASVCFLSDKMMTQQRCLVRPLERDLPSSTEGISYLSFFRMKNGVSWSFQE
jgi:hypothetical protein